MAETEVTRPETNLMVFERGISSHRSDPSDNQRKSKVSIVPAGTMMVAVSRHLLGAEREPYLEHTCIKKRKYDLFQRRVCAVEPCNRGAAC